MDLEPEWQLEVVENLLQEEELRDVKLFQLSF